MYTRYKTHNTVYTQYNQLNKKIPYNMGAVIQKCGTYMCTMVCLHMSLTAHMACNFNCFVESKELFKVIGSRM